MKATPDIMKGQEKYLWILSCLSILILYLILPDKDYLVIIATLIGATSLIFIAKGNVLGPIISIIFSIIYGYISFKNRYFGELLIYLLLLIYSFFHRCRKISRSRHIVGQRKPPHIRSYPAEIRHWNVVCVNYYIGFFRKANKGWYQGISKYLRMISVNKKTTFMFS